MLLIGSPTASALTSQPNTQKSGGVFTCPVSTNRNDCVRVQMDSGTCNHKSKYPVRMTEQYSLFIFQRSIMYAHIGVQNRGCPPQYRCENNKNQANKCRCLLIFSVKSRFQVKQYHIRRSCFDSMYT